MVSLWEHVSSPVRQPSLELRWLPLQKGVRTPPHPSGSLNPKRSQQSDLALWYATLTPGLGRTCTHLSIMVHFISKVEFTGYLNTLDFICIQKSNT